MNTRVRRRTQMNSEKDIIDKSKDPPKLFYTI